MLLFFFILQIIQINSLFLKIPNTFYSSIPSSSSSSYSYSSSSPSIPSSSSSSSSSSEFLFHWNEKHCSLAYYETRLLLPLECYQYLHLFKNNNMNINKWINENHIIVRSILITGTPRSGTTMVSQLSTSLGIELSNDSQPPSHIGTVNWAQAAPPHIRPICPPNSKIKLLPSPHRFQYIFHQVRDPLSSIPSLITMIPHWKKCKSQILQITPNMNYSKPDLHIALQIWIEWNGRLDRYPFIPVHRVEDFNFLDLLNGINYKIEISEEEYQCAYLRFMGYNTRSRDFNNKQILTWNHVFAIDKELGQKALTMAYNYGYRYYKNSTLVRMRPTYSKEYQKKYYENLIKKQLKENNLNQTLTQLQSKTPFPYSFDISKFKGCMFKRNPYRSNNMQIPILDLEHLSGEIPNDLNLHPIFIPNHL